MIPMSVKRNCKLIAQMNSPIDTGNLRFNAIHLRDTNNPNHFRIEFSAYDADYLEILQESTWKGKLMKNKSIHDHFIDYKVTPAIIEYVTGYFEQGKKPKFRKYSSSEEKGDFRRERVHTRSTDYYKSLREKE